jgi:hypothetical protein
MEDSGDDSLAALDAAMTDLPFGIRTVVRYVSLLRGLLR